MRVCTAHAHTHTEIHGRRTHRDNFVHVHTAQLVKPYKTIYGHTAPVLEGVEVHHFPRLSPSMDYLPASSLQPHSLRGRGWEGFHQNERRHMTREHKSPPGVPFEIISPPPPFGGFTNTPKPISRKPLPSGVPVRVVPRLEKRCVGCPFRPTFFHLFSANLPLPEFAKKFLVNITHGPSLKTDFDRRVCM
jgi:hypothetical protein